MFNCEMQNIHQCFFQWLQEFYKGHHLHKRAKPFYCNLHNGLSVYHVNKVSQKALNAEVELLSIAIFDNVKGKYIVEYFSMSDYVHFEDLRLEIMDKVVLDKNNKYYDIHAKQSINQLKKYL